MSARRGTAMRLGGAAGLALAVVALVLLVGLHAGRAAGAGRAADAGRAAADAGSTGASGATGLPHIGHVFVIVEENESASVTFGPNSPAPYLSKTLRADGAYLPKYYGVGHNSNDNYLAMISGQPPNIQTQADCLLFDNVAPGTLGQYGVANGTGCVYPADVPTIGSQLDKAGLSWRDYNDSMGAQPTRESAQCGHPALNTQDHTQTETATDQYASRHDPFVYFHSIIDNTTYCDQHVVNLDPLPHDLATMTGTPNYTFITPGLCDDGHDAKCANGGAGGLAQADAFLKQWVPRITTSPAFTQQNGLLMIVFDEATTSDSSSCCGEIPGPGSPLPGESGKGGGDTGAVLISPCIAPGTVTQTAYNHYTMLRSVEDLFGLSHLGYAQLPGETSFGSDIFTRACNQTPVVHVRARASGTAIRVSWAATSAHYASSYTVQVRAGSAGAWKTLKTKASATSLLYRGRSGTRYSFRVAGTGWNGTGSYATATARG